MESDHRANKHILISALHGNLSTSYKEKLADLIVIAHWHLLPFALAVVMVQCSFKFQSTALNLSQSHWHPVKHSESLREPDGSGTSRHATSASHWAELRTPAELGRLLKIPITNFSNLSQKKSTFHIAKKHITCLKRLSHSLLQHLNLLITPL